ncbi:hypothetical protein OIO90_001717 [Microbotryomycetes sp. JL221]|nr:hypothetical protein OIO90_001717 [Microbotryomycetes sp. JL221]
MADLQKRDSASIEKQEVHDIDEVALAGHTATDRHGNALVTIDKVAEAKLRRKIDRRVVPMVALLYLFCFIDRANIGNARIAGMEKDLDILPPKYGGYGYNLLLTAFYIAYVVFEPPCNFLCKWMGPGKYLPLLSFAFGLFSFVYAFVDHFWSAFLVRFLLGVAEAGVFPGFAFYLSRWYRKDELGFRLAMYIVMAPLAGAFGGLLASGFLSTDGFGKIRTWRIIFFAEGLITMGIAVISWFVLSDSPQVAPWLSEEEKKLAVARIKSENVGSIEAIEALHGKVVRKTIFNPTTQIVGLIFLLDNITVQGLGFFLPTIIRTIFPTYTVIHQQLMSVPPYLVGGVFTLLVPYLSWKTKRRALYMTISAPFMITGFAMFLGTSNARVRYGATFLIAIGAFSFGALCNAWSAANTSSDTAKAAALGTTVFYGNIGGLISTWSYQAKYAPSQVPGNAMNAGTSSAILLLTIGLWMWQNRENKAKDAGRDDHYLENRTADEIAMLEQQHPGFRYRT